MMQEKPNTNPALIAAHKAQKHRYETLLHRFKDSPQSLHFASGYSQFIRFLQFLAIGELKGRKILDIGCGLGGFFRFLDEQGIETDYMGYDIVSGFIDHCQRTYLSARFEERDILLAKPKEKFDYIFLSGTFAHGNRVFFEEMLQQAFSLCKTALAFNMFESQDEDFFQICREEVLFTCRRLNPKSLTMCKNYLPNDYTVFLYK